MNPFAVPALFSAICCGTLAAFIQMRVSRTRDAKLFSIMLVLMAAEAMLEFAYRVSGSRDVALLCWSLNGHWPFILAVLLNFVLVVTESHAWTDRPSHLFVIYCPAVVLAAAEWMSHPVTGPPIHAWWGWTYGPPATEEVQLIAFTWVLVVLVSSLAAIAKAWRNAEQSTERQRYAWTAVGLCVGLGTSIAEVIFSFAGIAVPPLTVPAYAFMVLPMGYGILRFEVFELTPVVAAEGIIATMSDALFLVGRDGCILYANRAAGNVIGTSKREIIGHPLSDVLGVTPDWINLIRQGLLTQRTLLPNVEAALPRDDGGVTEVLLTGTVVRGARGQAHGVVVIGRDISEQQRANRQLEEYRDHLEELVRQRTAESLATHERLRQEIGERRNIELQADKLEAQLHHAQRMEAVGRLAGGVAHDFNNLLTGIVGFAELVSASLPESDERRGDVSEILQAANRAGELVQQLLAFGRKQPIDRRIVDLDEMVASLQKMLSRIIGADVDLRIHQGPGLHLVDIDPGQFQQILVNLVVNARDAMPSGGTIEITTENATLGEEFCHEHEELTPGRYLRLTVRDTGSGMAPEVLAKVFEPFYTTKGPGQGTGLGLSIVYGLVRQNRGCIEVRSELQQGTTFCLHFPRSVGMPFSAHPPPVVLTRGGNEIVLVVDDEPALRRLATRVLGRQGYRVYTAPDAAQALLELERIGTAIDLLLTDMVMPGASGRQLADSVASICPLARVLFMSGYNDEVMADELAASDGVQLLAKPFSADTLLERVRAALDGSGGNRASPWPAVAQQTKPGPMT